MSRKTIIVLLLIVISACQPPATAVVETETTTPIPTAAATLTPTTTPTLEPTFTPTPAPLARRVLILSIDGLRPDAIALAYMNNLLALMESSAYSLTAQTIRPSATLPAHVSMLSGQCPRKHGVNWNDYMPEFGYAQVTDLFDIAHAAGLKTVMYVGKEKLRQITEPESTDVYEFIPDRDLVIVERLLENFPADFDLMFVHFPTADWMGHLYGWLSPEQFSVLFRADQALGNLLAELDARGIREETLIIVTADHGGHDFIHGSNLPEDMTIPWIAFGAGVQPASLTGKITTTDTAATAAFALNLPIPEEWDGVPVYEAFGLPVIEETRGCN
ncbi:MAG: alkaline phosphatase family protein [Anaerolineales bacterium]|nr:alkaline phosphatase family protein [Anaerolineales bacterium]